MKIGISIAINSRKNFFIGSGTAYDSLFLTIDSPDDNMYSVSKFSISCSLGIPGLIELTDIDNNYQVGHIASAILDFYTPVRSS